jgi:hypothetical protein
MAAAINWRHHNDGKVVDGATLPSGTGVRIASRRHLYPPTEYEVYQSIPKPFWRGWGSKEVLKTQLHAIPSAPDETGGWFFSHNIWRLPEPNNAAGTVTFRAYTDTRDCMSADISSARLWLNQISRRRNVTANAEAQLSLAGINFGPGVTREGVVERTWTVQVASDPWVEVSLLQGADVLQHLATLEEQYSSLFQAAPAPVMSELPADSSIYFVDRPFGDAAMTLRIEPGESVGVNLRPPDRQDLRSAACVSITDLTDGATVTSDVVFFTTIRDKIIATDLTLDMLRAEARDMLEAFDEVDLDVGSLADRLGLSPAETWERLTSAADELGADSISDAARFAGMATPAYA